MERNLSSSTDTTNLRYRFNSAYLVVSIHHRNEDRLICHCPSYIVRIYSSIAVNWEVGRFEAKAFQVLASMQHGMVLYRRGNNVIALFLRGKCYPFNGEVVAFRAASRKGDFRWTSVEHIGYLFTGAIN